MTETIRTLQGKVCLVTGATGGLGKGTAMGLARLGATVVIIGRSQARIEEAVQEICSQSGNESILGLCADLSVRDAVFSAAQEFRSRFGRLDVLVNNVGVTKLSYQATQDGFELSWALNYLYHFYLTQLLLDRLIYTAEQYGEARIIELTSSMYRFSSQNFSLRQSEKHFNGVAAYGQSKRALIVWACELTRRLEGKGVSINAVSPGYVATNMARKNNWWAELAMIIIRRFSKPVDEGVKPILYLATAPELKGVSGQYFYQYQRKKIDLGDTSPEAGQALWTLSQSMLS